ncbi:hypothetical protein [Sulfurovum sp.]|nr:hypothetical protein [Sulfurovum sp.]
MGSENFEGDLKTKKYQAITQTSTATAARDVRELLKIGLHTEYIKDTLQ